MASARVARLLRQPLLSKSPNPITTTISRSNMATAATAAAAPTEPLFPTPQPPTATTTTTTTPAMPPGFHATTAHNLPIFTLPPGSPDSITATPSNLALGRALVAAWRRDGIIQLATSPAQHRLWHAAHAASRAFFARPHADKAACVDPRSYAGYIASGEEVTAGVADYSEVFTVTKEFGVGDGRVRAGWPCHGPTPWPEDGVGGMREAMTGFGEGLGVEGERLVRLAEMGLGVREGALGRYTREGWHHMRVLR